jgi:hypothetical protein
MMSDNTSVENTAQPTENVAAVEVVTETKATETEPVGGGEGKETGKNEPPAWWEKRLSQVSGQKRELKSQVETLRQELQQLREALPKAEAKPIEKQSFSSEGEYIQAIAEQKAREIIAKDRESQMVAQQSAQQADALNGVWADAVSQMPDYADTIHSADESGMTIPREVRNALADSPDRPIVAYYLSKNPEAAKRLFQVPPSQMEREIVRLQLKSEDYWEKSKPVAAAAPSVPKPSTMPKLNGKPANAAPSLETLRGDDYMKEYRRLQAANRGRKTA